MDHVIDSRYMTASTDIGRGRALMVPFSFWVADDSAQLNQHCHVSHAFTKL